MIQFTLCIQRCKTLLQHEGLPLSTDWLTLQLMQEQVVIQVGAALHLCVMYQRVYMGGNPAGVV